MADPYTTLGVARGASDADIKKAYRKLAKELHPDTNQNNPKAAERFSRVTAAYDLLGDKAKRADAAVACGVAVPADDGGAGQREALLGADDMNDALLGCDRVDVTDAEIGRVLCKRRKLRSHSRMM